MENEIKVGEYVRTPEQGFIGKLVEINKDVLNYYKIDVGREIRRNNGMSDNYIYSRDGFGLKHSPNLIDLIQVGDMVHTRDVLNEDWYWMFDEEMVKATQETIEEGIDLVEIVTKEMMESISYKVERNN